MTARLKRLKILKFRDVRPGTELHFSDGWNVLVGHNATGKTTLLNLISMALRGDFTELRGEAFSLEYVLQTNRTTANISVRHAIEESPSFLPQVGSLSFVAPNALSQHSVTWAALVESAEGRVLFTTAVPFNDPGFPVRVMRPTGHEGTILNLGVHLSLREVREDDVAGLGELEHSYSSYRFDESLEMLRVISGERLDVLGLPPSHVSQGMVGRRGLFIHVSLIPSGWELSVEPADAHPSMFRVAFGACKQLAWALARLGGAEVGAVYPITEILHSEDEYLIASLGRPTFLMSRSDGTATSIGNLSFGQRRLFTFAWYLDSNPGPVVADELVNGMHYEWIEDCVRAMEGRQIFVTAQNPLLLDHVPFASAADVTRSFVLCRAEPSADGRREVVWSHPSDAQATEFFRAYENGLLRVHEILRTEGLW